MTTTILAGNRPDRSEVVAPHLLRWTKDDYHRMTEMGLFEGKRVELVEGEIIKMAPMDTPHWTSTLLVRDALMAIFQDGYTVTDQLPMSIIGESEPEPDVAVFKGQPRDYIEALPSDAELVVEVSSSTQHYDLGLKADLYARAEIKELWVLDTKKRELISHRDPRDGRYATLLRFGQSETVAALEAPEKDIKIADLLP